MFFSDFNRCPGGYYGDTCQFEEVSGIETSMVLGIVLGTVACVIMITAVLLVINCVYGHYVRSNNHKIDHVPKGKYAAEKSNFTAVSFTAQNSNIGCFLQSRMEKEPKNRQIGWFLLNIVGHSRPCDHNHLSTASTVAMCAQTTTFN